MLECGLYESAIAKREKFPQVSFSLELTASLLFNQTRQL